MLYKLRLELNLNNSVLKVYNCENDESIRIFHGCVVRIEKSVRRVTVLHHEACRVMPNSDPKGQTK